MSCIIQDAPKYHSEKRKAPPRAANDPVCHYTIHVGNDGLLYQSLPRSEESDYFTWQKLKDQEEGKMSKTKAVKVSKESKPKKEKSKTASKTKTDKSKHMKIIPKTSKTKTDKSKHMKIIPKTSKISKTSKTGNGKNTKAKTKVSPLAYISMFYNMAADESSFQNTLSCPRLTKEYLDIVEENELDNLWNCLNGIYELNLGQKPKNDETVRQIIADLTGERAQKAWNKKHSNFVEKVMNEHQ